MAYDSKLKDSEHSTRVWTKDVHDDTFDDVAGVDQVRSRDIALHEKGRSLIVTGDGVRELPSEVHEHLTPFPEYEIWTENPPKLYPHHLIKRASYARPGSPYPGLKIGIDERPTERMIKAAKEATDLEGYNKDINKLFGKTLTRDLPDAWSNFVEEVERDPVHRAPGSSELTDGEGNWADIRKHCGAGHEARSYVLNDALHDIQQATADEFDSTVGYSQIKKSISDATGEISALNKMIQNIVIEKSLVKTERKLDASKKKAVKMTAKEKQAIEGIINIGVAIGKGGASGGLAGAAKEGSGELLKQLAKPAASWLHANLLKSDELNNLEIQINILSGQRSVLNDQFFSSKIDAIREKIKNCLEALDHLENSIISQISALESREKQSIQSLESLDDVTARTSGDRIDNGDGSEFTFKVENRSFKSIDKMIAIRKDVHDLSPSITRRSSVLKSHYTSEKIVDRLRSKSNEYRGKSEIYDLSVVRGTNPEKYHSYITHIKTLHHLSRRWDAWADRFQLIEKNVDEDLTYIGDRKPQRAAAAMQGRIASSIAAQRHDPGKV